MTTDNILIDKKVYATLTRRLYVVNIAPSGSIARFLLQVFVFDKYKITAETVSRAGFLSPKVHFHQWLRQLSKLGVLNVKQRDGVTFITEGEAIKDLIERHKDLVKAKVKKTSTGPKVTLPIQLTRNPIEQFVEALDNSFNIFKDNIIKELSGLLKE